MTMLLRGGLLDCDHPHPHTECNANVEATSACPGGDTSRQRMIKSLNFCLLLDSYCLVSLSLSLSLSLLSLILSLSLSFYACVYLWLG